MERKVSVKLPVMEKNSVGGIHRSQHGRPPDLASNRATAHRLRCPQPPTGVSYTTTARGLRPGPRAPTSTPPRALCTDEHAATTPAVAANTPARPAGWLATAGEKRRASLGWC